MSTYERQVSAYRFGLRDALDVAAKLSRCGKLTYEELARDLKDRERERTEDQAERAQRERGLA